MTPTEDIERRIREARIEIDPQVKQAGLDELLDELDKPGGPRSAASKRGLLRAVITGKAMKLAAVFAFVFILFSLHQLRISIDGTSVARADVVKRLKRIRPYTARAHRTLTEVGREEPFFECDIVRYFSPEYGSVEQSYVDGELVMLIYCSIERESALILLIDSKECFRFDLNEELLSVVEYTNPGDEDAIMETLGPDRCVELGVREIDGIAARGFEIRDVTLFSQVPRFLLHPEDINIRLWVDEKTSLPARVEGQGFVNKSLMTAGKAFTYREVMHDIEYDAEIDAGVFDPDIPDDYTVIDPADMMAKAERVMLAIVPFAVLIVTYRHHRRKTRRTGVAADGSEPVGR